MRSPFVASAPATHWLRNFARVGGISCLVTLALGCGDEPREPATSTPAAAGGALRPEPAGQTPPEMSPGASAPGNPSAPGNTEPAPGAGSEGNGGVTAGASGSAGAPAVPEPPAMPEPVVPAMAPATLEDPLRILAVGDSITRATCWRALLWESLQQSFAGRFDLVGTLSEANGCAPAGYDRDNQGYSSSLITEIASGVTNARTCDPGCPTLDDLAAAFAEAQPDVVLMHFGTNDVWNGRAAEAIVGGYSQIVEAARAANPNVTILVAQIIPMNVTEGTCGGCSCANCAVDVPALNARIVGWASDVTSASSAVRVVDQFTGFDPSTDNGDGVHPNELGARKMADRWYEALAPLF